MVFYGMSWDSNHSKVKYTNSRLSKVFDSNHYQSGSKPIGGMDGRILFLGVVLLWCFSLASTSRPPLGVLAAPRGVLAAPRRVLATPPSEY